jgi:hypothetical protein
MGFQSPNLSKEDKIPCFVLSLGWERSDDEELPVALDAPLLDDGHNAPHLRV